MTGQRMDSRSLGMHSRDGQRKHMRWFGLVLAIGVAAASAGTIAILATAASAPSPAPASAPGVVPSGIPSAKAARIEGVDNQGSPAPNASTAKSGVAPALPSLAPPTRIVGIQDTNQGPFAPSTFVVRSFWEAPIGQTWYLVYAGGRPDDPASTSAVSQGSVALFTQGSDANISPLFQGFYAASSANGPLTITAASGSILTLQTDTGQIATFDVLTHQFG